MSVDDQSNASNPVQLEPAKHPEANGIDPR